MALRGKKPPLQAIVNFMIPLKMAKYKPVISYI